MEEAPVSTAVHRVPWPRNERGVLAGVKSTSYAENVVALAQAAEHGASEAVFANLAGDLCEGTGSNVGYVVDGEARTPTLAAGCLAGITRELLLEWGEVVEVDAPVEVLDEADEMFLMSTTRDVQGVHRVDGRGLDGSGSGDAGAEGPVVTQGVGEPRPLGRGRSGVEAAAASSPSKSTNALSWPSGTEASIELTKECTVRESAWTSSSPSGEHSSMITTAAPVELRQGHTWTSPSPVGS